MLCAILRNTWPKSSVLVTPTRKSIRFYRGKVRKLLGKQENNCTFVDHKWKTDNGQDYVQAGDNGL